MFKLKDYIFVPKDILILGKRFWFWSHYTDWMGIIILIAYIIVFGWLFNVPFEPLFFIGYIMAILYWGFDSRISIGLALLCLIIIPLLLFLFEKSMLGQGEAWAEQTAVWAYYFLVIGVIKQIFEYREEAKAKKNKRIKLKVIEQKVSSGQAKIKKIKSGRLKKKSAKLKAKSDRLRQKSEKLRAKSKL